MSLEMAQKVIVPQKKNYVPRDINSYYKPVHIFDSLHNKEHWHTVTPETELYDVYWYLSNSPYSTIRNCLIWLFVNHSILLRPSPPVGKSLFLSLPTSLVSRLLTGGGGGGGVGRSQIIRRRESLVLYKFLHFLVSGLEKNENWNYF